MDTRRNARQGIIFYYELFFKVDHHKNRPTFFSERPPRQEPLPALEKNEMAFGVWRSR